MAATRENVLSAISKYVEDHGRRAPAKEIAVLVGDTVQNTQAMIKELVAAGQIKSSRGRYGGSMPVDAVVPRKEASETVSQPDNDGAADQSSDVASQFAALMAQLQQDESIPSSNEDVSEAVVG